MSIFKSSVMGTLKSLKKSKKNSLRKIWRFLKFSPLLMRKKDFPGIRTNIFHCYSYKYIFIIYRFENLAASSRQICQIRGVERWKEIIVVQRSSYLKNTYVFIRTCNYRFIINTFFNFHRIIKKNILTHIFQFFRTYLALL